MYPPNEEEQHFIIKTADGLAGLGLLSEDRKAKQIVQIESRLFVHFKNGDVVEITREREAEMNRVLNTATRILVGHFPITDTSNEADNEYFVPIVHL